MKEPFFIIGAHKSGSSLLRSLLDGHPELFVVPFEAHFFQGARFWVDYQLRKTLPAQIQYDDVKRAYIEVVQHYNSVSDMLSDANLVGQLEIERFRQAISADEADSFAHLITQYVNAIHQSLHHSPLPSGKHVVEKSVENTEFALDLVELFPDARFVHIVRNPYANLVSIRRHAGRSSYAFLGPILRSMQNSHYHLLRNRRLIKNYFVVRYEDVLSDTTTTMKAIAQFLTIEYTPDLLKPTCLGFPWYGNSSRDIEYTEVAVENLDKWRPEINSLEVYYTTRYFRFILESYGYDVLQPKTSHWWPVKQERPKTYLLNRLALYYL